eukprot:204409-Prorocentrum_minimum.AAC.2
MGMAIEVGPELLCVVVNGRPIGVEASGTGEKCEHQPAVRTRATKAALRDLMRIKATGGYERK